MNLISEVARLKAHCTQQPGYFAVLERLLDVLGEIRAGDADILDGMATWFACSDDPDQFSRQIEILRRYRDMARKMETNR
jgi:hypothetical protein